MRGDVLFYSPSRGNIIEYVIARATNGPFCHCAIDLGDGSVYEARQAGICHDSAARPVAARFSPDPAGVDAGLAWAAKQLGQPYGWWDIFDQFLRLTLHTTLYVARPRDYDCSDYCTRYLLAVGQPVGTLAFSPHLATPNDLARQLGVLPKDF